MAAPAAPAAILWDMDGTLVDTEPYWIECEHALVREFGGTWTDADAHSIIGADLLDAGRALRDRGGVGLEPQEIVERLLDGVITMIAERLPWQPGVRDLLEECRVEGVPCVLVTMSWRRLADAVIAAAPDEAFAGSVTGDEVTHGKPHPEPYLAAAAAIGVEPGHCIAIEDSPTGTRSALAAGCRTVGVPHVVALDPQPGLTIVPTLRGVRLDDLVALVGSGVAR